MISISLSCGAVHEDVRRGADPALPWLQTLQSLVGSGVLFYPFLNVIGLWYSIVPSVVVFSFVLLVPQFEHS